MWSEKYEPRSLEELTGNRKQAEEVSAFVKGKQKKAMMLYGPPGTGKSLAVKLLDGYEIIRMTGEDFRGKESVNAVLGAASKQQSLLMKKKVLVVDELETMDSSGKRALGESIKQGSCPVILIADDAYDTKLRTLRQLCILVRFNRIRFDVAAARLMSVAKNERLALDKSDAEQIARQSNGDMRSALNDLEVILTTGVHEETSRDSAANMFDTIRIVLKSSDMKNAFTAIGNMDKDIEDLMWWLEENILMEYTSPEEIAAAYNLLSQWDVFSSRIIRRQSWSLKKYGSAIVAAISMAKTKKHLGFVRYSAPKFRYNQASPLLEKISNELHISKSKASKYVQLVKAHEERGLIDTSVAD